MTLRVPSRFARRVQAFTLLEVMIASGIFFVAVFAILGLVAGTLRNARALQRPQVDAGLVAAQYVCTNRFYEGTIAGDFGDVLQDFSWEVATAEAGTNGLLQADVVLRQRGVTGPADAISILVFDPNFQTGPARGPAFRGGPPGR